MWYAFGVFTLAVSIGLSVWARIEARWKPTGRFSTPRGPFEYLLTTYRESVLHYHIGIRGAAGFDFVLKPERWYDKIFKLLSISSEVQLSDPFFDRAWYVVSEDWLLRRALAASPSFRRDLLHLLNECSRLDVKLKHLRCQSGRLWVAVKPKERKADAASQRLYERAQALVPLLYRIEAHLTHLRPERFKVVRDRYARRAIAVLSVSTGFAVFAAIHLFRLEFVRVPFLVDAKPLAWQAIIVGSVALGVLVLAALLALGGTSRAHLVLFELVLTGSFAFGGSAFVTLRDINMDFDASEGTTLEVTVVNMEYQRRRRGPDDYYLHVTDWTGRGGTRRIEVSSGFYQRVRRGDRLRVVQRSGYLGHPWVEGIALANRSP